MVGKTEINARLVWFAWWTVAAIVFALVIAIRIRLLGIPLERDEGECRSRRPIDVARRPSIQARLQHEVSGNLCSLRRDHVNLRTNN